MTSLYMCVYLYFFITAISWDKMPNQCKLTMVAGEYASLQKETMFITMKLYNLDILIVHLWIRSIWFKLWSPKYV